MNNYTYLFALLLLFIPYKKAMATEADSVQCVTRNDLKLTLSDCKQMAHNNYPLIKQYQLLDLSCNFTLSNAAKGWLPRVSATAGAYAFTNIIDENNPMQQRMGIDLKNWVASASVTIQQNVYDGGQTSALKEVTKAQNEMQKQQVNVTMYAINEQINQLYFGILLLNEQLKQNDLLLKEFATSEQNIRSMIKGGLASQTDLDAILVEKLKVHQQKEQLQTSRKAYLKMLGVFIGKDLPESACLEKPALTVPSATWGVNRPEMQYYSAQKSLLAAQRKQLDARLRPTIGFFGTGMVHTNLSDVVNKGLLAGGISLSWNIGAFYTRKNDLKKLRLQEDMFDTQQATFIFNNRLQNEEVNGTITSLSKQMEQDDEIIRLRERIRLLADKQVQLGTKSINPTFTPPKNFQLFSPQNVIHNLSKSFVISDKMAENWGKCSLMQNVGHIRLKK